MLNCIWVLWRTVTFIEIGIRVMAIHHRLIIIGLALQATQFIYAARANLSPVIITGMEQGGN